MSSPLKWGMIAVKHNKLQPAPAAATPRPSAQRRRTNAAQRPIMATSRPTSSLHHARQEGKSDKAPGPVGLQEVKGRQQKDGLSATA